MPHTALVRRPGAELLDCELTHLERRPIDLGRALEQHRDYMAALTAAGCEIEFLPELPDHPDACFVEDTAVVLDGAAVIARPGADSRRGEVAATRAWLASRLECIDLQEPCTLDGGDVCRVDDVLLCGWSSRTNHAGLKALAHAVLSHGFRVTACEVRGTLHLKSACTWLGDDRLLAAKGLVNLQRVSELEIVAVPDEEPHGANVLRVGDRLFCSASAPRTLELLDRLGYAVTALEITEFEKAEAGLTCLSILVPPRT